jgi:hypothetical protein
VQRKENKTLKAAAVERLAWTRDDWLRSPAAMEPKDARKFTVLKILKLKTARNILQSSAGYTDV